MKRLFFLAMVFSFSAIALFGQETSDDFFKLGNQQAAEKKYDAAINSFSECIRIKPTAAGCYQNRAFVYNTKAGLEPLTSEQLGKADGVNLVNETRRKALADINKAIELNPKAATMYFLRAFIYSDERIYDKALADFRQGFDVQPNLATTNAAAFKQATDRLAKVERDLTYSMIGKGKDAVQRGYSAYDKGDKAGGRALYEQAIKFFTDAAARDKTNTEALSNRAEVYQRLENYDAAIADYNAIMQISEAQPDVKTSARAYATALVDRAYVYSLQKKPALQLADYEKMLAMPASEETTLPRLRAYLSRGIIRYESGKTDDALADFNLVLDNQAGFIFHGTATLYRGLAHLKKGNKPQGIADINKSFEVELLSNIKPLAITEIKKLNTDPDSIFNAAGTTAPPPTAQKPAAEKTAEQLFAEGTALAKQKDFGGAIAAFDKCIALKADAFPCFLFRGNAYNIKGKMNEAMADYNRTIQLNPNLPSAYVARGVLYMKLQKKDLAESDFRAALKIEPDHRQAKQGLQILGVQP
jgi:tetratricopeptide (TPR) repeat protein